MPLLYDNSWKYLAMAHPRHQDLFFYPPHQDLEIEYDYGEWKEYCADVTPWRWMG